MSLGNKGMIYILDIALILVVVISAITYIALDNSNNSVDNYDLSFEVASSFYVGETQTLECEGFGVCKKVENYNGELINICECDNR